MKVSAPTACHYCSWENPVVDRQRFCEMKWLTNESALQCITSITIRDLSLRRTWFLTLFDFFFFLAKSCALGITVIQQYYGIMKYMVFLVFYPGKPLPPLKVDGQIIMVYGSDTIYFEFFSKRSVSKILEALNYLLFKKIFMVLTN